MSFLTYAIAAKLERGTHLLDTLVSKQDIPKDQLERDLNTLQFNSSTLLKAELIERDFHKAVDVLFTKRLVARGNASYGVEIEGEERVIESLKLVHQVTNDDIYQSGLQSLAHHLGSRKLIETTNAVVLGGDIELTDAEYDLEKPYTDETIATILKSAETDEKAASENVVDEMVDEHETVDEHEAVDNSEHEMADGHETADEHETVDEHETADEHETVEGHGLVDEHETVEEHESVDEHEIADEHETADEHEIEHVTEYETTDESEIEHEKADASEQAVVDSVESSEVITDTVTPSETATEAATKEFPFSDDELTELAKGVIERGNELAADVPDFGHSETSDVLAVLGDSSEDVKSTEVIEPSEVVSDDVHASEQKDVHASEQVVKTSDVSEAEALNHMIDEISTDLKTSEKSEVDVTASEGPSVEDVAKAFGGSLDGVSVVSNLGRLHEVGKPITSQFAR